MAGVANRLIAALALACTLPAGSARATPPSPPARQAAEATALVPARQVQLQNQLVPHWKEIWDEGRRLARMGDYPGAVQTYRLLLGEREELAAARWEMVKILLQLKRFEPAAESLERLLEREPERLEYLQGLAVMVQERGQHARAIELFKKILEQQPNNQEALAGSVDCFLALGQKEQALPLLEKLLGQQPGEERRRQLAELYLERGDTAKARPLLLALGNSPSTPAQPKREVEKRASEAESVANSATMEATPRHKAAVAVLAPATPPPLPDWAVLERSARWAEREGQLREAIALYRQLLELRPEDPGIIATLAREHGLLGEEEEALALWTRLVPLIADPLPVQRTRATLLARLGREAELLVVLEELRILDPRDAAVILQLAGLYLDRGDLAASRNCFETLVELGVRSEEFLARRGQYYEASDQPLLALDDYLELLALRPERLDLRRRVVVLAGEAGRLELVRAQAAGLSGDGEGRFLLAEALRACRADEEAVAQYRDPSAAGGGESLPALLALAALQEEAGRPYEAEQELRQALAYGYREAELLARLFRLALAGGRLAEAEGWLAGLNRVEPDSAWRVRLARVRLLAARGKARMAAELAAALGADLLASASGGAAGENLGPARQALLDFWLEQGEWSRATALALELLGREPDWLVPRVALQLIYERTGAVEKEAEVAKVLLARAREPMAALRCAKLYRRYRMAWPTIQFVRQFLERVPDSLAGKFLLAEGLTMAGESREAARQWQTIIRDYPGNRTAVGQLAELDFARGEFVTALAGAESLLREQPARAEMVLLKERLLWARQDWSAAIEVVRSYLEPPVAEALQAALKAEALPPLPQPGQQRSWWERATLAPDEEPDPLAATMAPGRFLAPDSEMERRVGRVAASFLARYRWQTKLAAELSIRRSVQRREYYLAVKLYEGFLANYPDDDSLWFDLAGVYSRLDRLAEEAAVYRQLVGKNADYPGLQEAATRNGLKQRPQLALRSGYAAEGGRDGYRDMETIWQELRLTQFPQPGQTWEVAAANLDYQAMARHDGIQAKRATVAYRNLVWHGVAVEMGGGMESLGEGADFTMLHGGLEGKLGDKLLGQLSFARELVSDTPASVRRRIARQSSCGGLGVDLIRLLAGADYQRQDYSDGNHANGYNLWASYIVFTEPTSLKVNYTYEFKDSATGPTPGVPTADGFGADDHPYWAPKNYWSNQVGLDFKHILSEDTLGRGVPRYYTLAYTVGSDSNGYALQTGRGGFFVELAPNFMLDATVTLSSSQAHRSKAAMVTATYRW